VTHNNILYNDPQTGCYKTFLIVVSERRTFSIIKKLKANRQHGGKRSEMRRKH
jgi:hypothetical protein